MDLQFENRLHNLIQNPPAFVSIKYTSTEHRNINLTGLKNYSMPNLDNFLSKERHVLNRLLYQMNNGFKRHKYFQYAKRLSKILTRIDDMQKNRFFDDIILSLELFRDDSCCFISQERFDFILCNLFVIIRYFETIPIICENCYKYLGNFLDLGHFAAQCCLFVGLAAIFRSECLKMANRLIEIYQSVVPYVEKLKPANENYVHLTWPRKEKICQPENQLEFAVKSETTIKYMSFFEEFLKNYNKKIDFKVDLNRALLDKLQNNDNVVIDFLHKKDPIEEFGIVIERKENDLILLKEEAKNIDTVKKLKLFYKHSIKMLKMTSKSSEKSTIKKAARFVRQSYFSILAAKKATNERNAIVLLQNLKSELLNILR